MLRVLFFLTIIIPILINGQLTLSNGHHVLEITGAATTYYNNRFLNKLKLNTRKIGLNSEMLKSNLKAE